MKVRYLGPREPYIDTLFGTNLLWEAVGDVHEVNDTAGARMVNNHPDMFEEVKPKLESKKHEHVQQIAARYGVEQSEAFEKIEFESRSGSQVSVSEASRADMLGLMDRLGLKTTSKMTRQDALEALEEYYKMTGSLAVAPSDSVEGRAAAPAPEADEPGEKADPPAGGEQGDDSGLQPDADPEPEASATPPPDLPPSEDNVVELKPEESPPSDPF